MTDAMPLPSPALNPARRAILLVVGLLMLPFAIATGLYWFEWRPSRLANTGELIQPPQALPQSGLLRSDGSPLTTAELHHKWTLVLFNKGPCTAACQHDLQQMRQVQVAQNKEMGRLRRVLIADDILTLSTDPALPELRNAYPDLLIAAPSASSEGKEWRARLDSPEHRFQVIDPLGNIMMRYPHEPDMKGMRKDLERLLKYSWVG